MTTENLSRLQAKLKKTRTDVAILGAGAHMDWVLGFHPHADERPCLLFVTQTDTAFLMPALNADAVAANSAIRQFKWADEDGPDNALSQLLSHIALPSAAAVSLDETMRADFALLAINAMDAPDVGFTENTVSALRMVKSADDLQELSKNARIADEALKKAFAFARPGVTELEVAEVIRTHFRENDAAPLFTIVGAAANGAFPHHQTSNRTLKEGDAVVVDIGARNGRFSSDITRMMAIGHAPDGYQDVHDVVEQAVQAALKAARPGVLAKEIDKSARDVIDAAGYGEFFVHRTGHGLGLEGHEPPYLTKTSDTPLEAGMVFSIEPGIYLPDRFGIRLEEIVYLHDHGPEVLSGMSRDLVTLEV